jgi:hypothetical protein
MPLMSPRTVFLVLGVVLCWGGPWDVEAAQLHHHRRHHPVEEHSPPSKYNFPLLEKVLSGYDVKRAHHYAPRPLPTLAPTTTTTLRPFLAHDMWKLNQAKTNFLSDYEDDGDDSDEYNYPVSTIYCIFL